MKRCFCMLLLLALALSGCAHTGGEKNSALSDLPAAASPAQAVENSKIRTAELEKLYPGKTVLIWLTSNTYSAAYNAEVNRLLDSRGKDYAVAFIWINEKQENADRYEEYISLGGVFDIMTTYDTTLVNYTAPCTDVGYYASKGWLASLHEYVAGDAALLSLYGGEYFDRFKTGGELYGFSCNMRTPYTGGSYLAVDRALGGSFRISSAEEWMDGIAGGEVLQRIKSDPAFSARLPMSVKGVSYTEAVAAFVCRDRYVQINNLPLFYDTGAAGKEVVPLWDIPEFGAVRAVASCLKDGRMSDDAEQPCWIYLLPATATPEEYRKSGALPDSEWDFYLLPFYPTASNVLSCISDKSAHKDSAYELLSLAMCEAALNNTMVYGVSDASGFALSDVRMKNTGFSAKSIAAAPQKLREGSAEIKEYTAKAVASAGQREYFYPYVSISGFEAVCAALNAYTVENLQLFAQKGTVLLAPQNLTGLEELIAYIENLR